jgi:glycosyltransferase involved in cell wall biosynthesis
MNAPRRLAGTVVLAVPDFEPGVGGTVRHGGLVARGLARRGYDVVVVTRRREAGWARREWRDGLLVERVGPLGIGAVADARALLALARRLRRSGRRIAVVQTLMWPDAASAAAAAGVLRRTVVMWAIRGEIEQALAPGPSARRRVVVALRRRHLARCAHVTLTPSMEAELAAAALPVRSAVIPVPVDTTAFRPATDAERERARAALDLAPDAFVVVYVGHLEPRKGVERLVEAFGHLAGDDPGARLLLVGGGRGRTDDTESALRALVRAQGLDEQVRFFGVQPDPRPYLRAADVFALPSFREGMPNTLLEAMASGLPCVAPPSAGGDELLDAETGVVPASNEPADLLAALLMLAADPSRRAALGRAAAERALAFDVERVLDRFVELYGSIASGARDR